MPLATLLKSNNVKIRFVVVGIWNTIFGYLAFVSLDLLFTPLFSRRYFAYMLAVVLSNFMAILNAYLFHKYVTFKSPVRGKGIIIFGSPSLLPPGKK